MDLLLAVLFGFLMGLCVNYMEEPPVRLCLRTHCINHNRVDVAYATTDPERPFSYNYHTQSPTTQSLPRTVLPLPLTPLRARIKKRIRRLRLLDGNERIIPLKDAPATRTFTPTELDEITTQVNQAIKRGRGHE